VREYLTVFMVAAAVTYLLGVVARELATRFGAVARVRDRDMHAIPIPYFGGVAMLGGLLAAYAVARRLPFLSTSSSEVWHDASVVLIGGVFVCALGVLDDLLELDALMKFGGQVLAASFLVLNGVYYAFFQIPGGGQFAPDQTQAAIATVILVVATVNAVNFVDGLDGLAAGVVGIGAVAFFAFSYRLAAANGETLAITAALLCAALGGGVFEVEVGMDLEERSGLLGHAVGVQPGELDRGDLRKLRLVGVERRDASRDRRVLGRLAVGIHQVAGGRVQLGSGHRGAVHPQAVGEAKPQLGMVVRAVLLVPQVLQDGLAVFGLRRSRQQHREHLRERRFERVVLARVVTKLVGRERPGGPAPVERVLQEASIPDQLVDDRHDTVRLHHGCFPPVRVRTRARSLPELASLHQRRRAGEAPAV